MKYTNVIGISLTVEQYKFLCNTISNGLIDEELKVIGADI